MDIPKLKPVWKNLRRLAGICAKRPRSEDPMRLICRKVSRATKHLALRAYRAIADHVANGDLSRGQWGLELELIQSHMAQKPVLRLTGLALFGVGDCGCHGPY